MKIYEINAEMERLISESVDPETGELKLDFGALDALQLERDTKLENLALLIKNKTADIEAFAAEIKSLTDRKNKLDKEVARMKEYLEFCLGGAKFETPRVSVTFRKSEKVVPKDGFIQWAMFNAPDLLREKDPEPDKVAIKQRIAEQGEMEFAEIETTYTMKIK